MTAIDAEKVERKRNAIPTIKTLDIRRTRTDKYWIILFIAILFIWCVSAKYVIHRKPDGKINFNDTTTKPSYDFNFNDSTLEPSYDFNFNDSTSELSYYFNYSDSTSEQSYELNFFDNKTDCNATGFSENLRMKTYEYVSQIWGKNWFFDALTFNIGFLDTDYEQGGSIAILTHFLFSICLLIYSYTSFPRKQSYNIQGIHVLYLINYCIFVRFIYNGTQNNDILLGQALYMYCPLPELLLYFLIIIVLIFCKPKSEIYWLSGRGKENWEPKDWIPFYVTFATFFVSIFVSIVLLVLDKLNFTFELDWNHQVSYAFVGSSCYLLLTIYYFLLMVISCATSIGVEQYNFYCITEYPRAILIIARYHFGTVCYHATLLLPRIHATFIMNEKEFKKNFRLSVIKRLYLTYWKISDSSMMLTATRGHSYSNSTRKLLRLFAIESIEVENFRINFNLYRSYSAYLIAANSLQNILLWICSVTIDSQLCVGSWVIYLIAIFLGQIIARFLDSVSDTVWFCYNEKETTDDEIC